MILTIRCSSFCILLHDFLQTYTPPTMDIQPQKRSSSPARTSSVWLQLHKIMVLRRKQKNKQKKQLTSFLSLPLELRILVYRHAISDEEHNITKRRHGHRLPGLFHTHPQITHEIYQFCHITTIINIALPLLPPRGFLYNPIKVSQVFIILSRLYMARQAVREFGKLEGPRQLSMKVKIKCLGCKKDECKGLDWENPCYKCLEHIHKWNRRCAGIVFVFR